MHCKLERRVGATRAAWLGLAALFARARDGATGVSASLKPSVAANRAECGELQD